MYSIILSFNNGIAYSNDDIHNIFEQWGTNSNKIHFTLIEYKDKVKTVFLYICVRIKSIVVQYK